MKNKYTKLTGQQYIPDSQFNHSWQGWPLISRRFNWLDRHAGKILGLIIIVGSIFCFVCGVVVGMIQPPLYRWIMFMLGIGG